VWNKLGAIVTTRIPRPPEVACHGEGHSRDARFGCAVRDLTDLPLEGGDGGRHQYRAPLAVLVGLVPAHAFGLEPCDVEARDQVEVDHGAKFVERMRPLLRERALRDTAAGSIDAEVKRTEVVGRTRDRGFGAGEVGDVTGVETRATAESGRDLFPLRARAVEDRDALRPLPHQHLGRRAGPYPKRHQPPLPTFR
jgi:hypothetical protein